MLPQVRDQLLSSIDQLLASADRGRVPAEACAEILAEVERQLAAECPARFPRASAWAWGSRDFPPVVAFPEPPDPPPTPPVPPAPPAVPYSNATKISIEAKGAALADVLRTFGKSCTTNLVVPDFVKAQVTIDLKQVPCDQAIEVLLEAHGLWYRHVAGANLLSIAPRRQIAMEDDERAARARDGTARADDELPAGTTIDLDVKDAPLPDILRMFAGAGGVNIVLPENVGGGKLTVRLEKVRWDHALRAVLAAHGLGYRYREKGKLLRIAPARELVMEDDESRARDQRR
jgi:type II secretory pathway component HofQ